MLKNLPEPNIFLDNSIDYLHEAFSLAADFTQFDYDDFYFTNDKYDEEEFRIKNRVRINTIGLLVFTSIENYLKYIICLESPFLLIADLSTLKHTDTDFDKHYMHSFDDLLKIYTSLYEDSYNSKIKTKFDSLKESRNHFIHGTGTKNLDLKQTLTLAYDFIFNIWNKNTPHLHRTFFDYIAERTEVAWGEYEDKDNIISVLSYDEDIPHSKLLRIYQILLHFLGKNKALQILNLKNKANYLGCAICSNESYYMPLIKKVNFAIKIRKNNIDYAQCQLCFCSVAINSFILFGFESVITTEYRYKNRYQNIINPNIYFKLYEDNLNIISIQQLN